MIDEFISLLIQYLKEEIDIDAVDDWIAVHIWDASDEVRDNFIDPVFNELCYIRDGYSDESHFRSRVRDIVVPTLELSYSELPEVTITTSSNDARIPVNFSEEPPPLLKTLDREHDRIIRVPVEEHPHWVKTLHREYAVG